MRQNKSKIVKYFKEYKWSNVFAMIRNNRLDPLICNDDFKDKLVVITGATSGIGYVTAKKYASKGANLICINRNKEKSEALSHEIEKRYNVKCDCFLADLSIIDDTKNVANKLLEIQKPIDVIIHNAGIHLTKREITKDGIEKVFMIQHLSSFIINFTLKDKLKSQHNARIILVNSEGHRFAAWGLKIDDLNWTKRRYSGLKSYGSAKLSQLLSMLIFHEYFHHSGVLINAMHPGAVKTKTGQENGSLYKWYKRNILDKMLRSVEISAEALYYLGVSKELDAVSGKFFNLTTEEEPAPPALDREAAYEIWEKSIELTGLKDSNK